MTDDQFSIDLRAWMKKGLIQPAVNGLEYKDVEGNVHHASILPNGSVQANAPGGRVYRTVRSWMASFVDLGPGQKKSWEFEMKRVRYKNIPMWRLYYLAKNMDVAQS